MSVVCSKCGEELMGAVNRCWKCGTPFIRSETVRTSSNSGSENKHTTQLQIPPVRRAPILQVYLAPANHMEEQPLAAIIEEEEGGEILASADASDTIVARVPTILESLPIDYPSLGGCFLAGLACLVCYGSILGVLLAAVAVILNVYLLSHRRSKSRWLGFGFSILSLLAALTRTIASLYFWFTGLRLATALFG